MATTQKRSSRTVPAEEARRREWKKLSDRGPHQATLPSGLVATFKIPDTTALIRADLLPDRLSEIAVMASSYPDGVEGYLGDLGLSAMANPERDMPKLKRALKDGLELRDWLIAEMLVDPKLTAKEVASGDYPPADLEMLLEFAERRRDTDHLGVKLPITVLEGLKGFPAPAVDDEAARAGANGEPAAPEPDRGADGDDV
jgi:hypothetical protein